MEKYLYNNLTIYRYNYIVDLSCYLQLNVCDFLLHI